MLEKGASVSVDASSLVEALGVDGVVDSGADECVIVHELAVCDVHLERPDVDNSGAAAYPASIQLPEQAVGNRQSHSDGLGMRRPFFVRHHR